MMQAWDEKKQEQLNCITKITHYLRYNGKTKHGSFSCSACHCAFAIQRALIRVMVSINVITWLLGYDKYGKETTVDDNVKCLFILNKEIVNFMECGSQ